MKYFKLIIPAIIIVLFTFVGIKDLVNRKQHEQFKQMQIKSLQGDFNKLEIKYKSLTDQLKEEQHKKNINEQKVNDLKKEKKELEKKLQAKAEAKQRKRAQLAKAAEEATGTSVAYAASLPSGSHQDWLRRAGISPGDFSYADFIIMREGHYDPCVVNGGAVDCSYAVNGGQKAYGVCQALPGSKMASAGKDWATNPITQLRWCHSYAQGKGGWAASYQFWISHNWW